MFSNASYLKRSLVSLLTLAALIGTSDVALGTNAEFDDLNTAKENRLSAVAKRTERPADYDTPAIDDLPPRKQKWYLIMPGIEFVEIGELKAKKGKKSKKQDAQTDTNAAEILRKSQEQKEERAQRLQNRNGKKVTVVEPENLKPQGKKRPRAEKQPIAHPEKEPLYPVAQRGLPIFDFDNVGEIDSSDSDNSTGNKSPKLDVGALDFDAIDLALQEKISKPIMSMPPAMELPTFDEKPAAVPVVESRFKPITDNIEELQSQLTEPTKMNPHWRVEKWYYEDNFYHEFKGIHAYLIRWAKELKECLKLISQNNGNVDILQQRVISLNHGIVTSPCKKTIKQAATRFKQYDDMRTFSTGRTPDYKRGQNKYKMIGFIIPDTLSNDGALCCLKFLKDSSAKAVSDTPENFRHYFALQNKSRFYTELYELCQRSIAEFNKITK
jgi:hypothetical protein